jgi:predicted site-specific integrase-resolvase
MQPPLKSIYYYLIFIGIDQGECLDFPQRRKEDVMIVGQKVGYARVSTSGQDLSLQLERLVDCDRIFQEKVSWGRGAKRPALNEALAYVRNGDIFIVTKLNRLARSVFDLMQITQTLQDKNCDK